LENMVLGGAGQVYSNWREGAVRIPDDWVPRRLEWVSGPFYPVLTRIPEREVQYVRA
jgi:hypothetical protein